ncbi:MAG: AraC family transcriptional regulator [Filimonas sp.]|nr:AraC family transcriptional regulator [Filimonas sp.]
MNTGQQILFFVSVLGAFNGIVLSLYLFISKRTKSVAALFLGVMLLAISIRVAKSVFFYFNCATFPKTILQVGLSACFLIGPAVFYFFKSVLQKVTQVPNQWKWAWGINVGFILIGGLILPYETHPWFWNKIMCTIIYLQWFAYLIATGVLLRKEIRRFFKGESHQVTERFWLLLYGGNCLLFLLYAIALLGVVQGAYITSPIAFSLILYVSIFFYVYGARMENILMVKEEDGIVNAKRKIADSDAASWVQKLETVLEAKSLYKNPDLKVSDLATAIGITSHQLSQLLNENLGKSFSTFINEYRVTEACKLIAMDDRLTLEAIGYEVGFNSKSTFYTAFRKVKDTTPALYKEQVSKIDIE